MNIKYKKNMKKNSFNIAILLLLAFIIFYKVFGINILFHYIIGIFCATFGISLSIVTLLRNTKGYYNYVGIGFLFIGIIEYIKILMSKTVERESDIRHIFIFVVSNNILLFLVILVAFILMKKKVTNIKCIKIYTILTLSIVFFNYFLANISKNEKEFLQLFFYVYIFKVILIIIDIVVVLKLRKDKNKVKYRYIYSYLIFTILYQCCYDIILRNNYNNIIFKADIFKYIAYFSIYEGIRNNVLNLAYYEMKSNLEKLRIKQSELNMKLKQRNTILNELKVIKKKSEKRYYDLIESFKDGLLIFNVGKLTYINEEALKILGFNYKEELLGKDIEFIIGIIWDETEIRDENLVHQIDLISFVKSLYKFKNKRKSIRELELHLVNNNEKRQILYIRDIAEINKYNKMRKEYEEYLREEEVKNKFYSNISHELRTPINVISSALTLNEVHLNNYNMESISKNNEVIKQNCLRLIRTINNFIDANKISEGYLRPNKKVYNLVEVIENVTIATNKYVKRINNSLIFDSSHEEVYLPVDKNMIERIMLNLLSNSVKHGENNKKIEVNINLQEYNVVITVRNNARLIENEEKKYMFDEFTKINKTLNRNKEGSGLGLFLSKTLIELHNGTINFKASKECGNKFTIKFPLEDLLDYDMGENSEIVTLNRKVDIEFSDIYL
ncbi:ATP-binding protein [Eubacterium multiforme]|uniref:histidine kinase n=1 Tax=Eubacterium multiforme TaxID=83339 RepID=A0ABT9UP66_9FIRM|nr:ATP-binding protein [Eubacterium multiforme]MDQ0148436.1 PAS domain S-box-containing protein [Eubacterium multiforme]